MAEHDTPAAGQHRRSGWYWVRWTRDGFWFPVQWFREHDGQEFWVGGRAGQPAAEVGSRIHEMGEDQREGYTMQDDTPVDSDTIARRLARDVVSKYTTLAGTYGELLHLERIIDDAIVIALAEKEAEIARLKRELANKERETIERCAALAELEPELPGEIPESIRRHIMSSPDTIVRSVCRTTKNSIANAIRALAGGTTTEPESPGETPEKTKSAATDHPDPMARFVPRATKRAIVKEVMGALAGKAAPDAHGGPAHKAQAEDEIEITPEMIEAGLSGLWQFHPDRQDEREAVRGIFLKMLRARR